MSRTVSFRASEELDEFLEQEAERRMTTKSTVANMLIAERVRQIQSEASEDSASKAVGTTVEGADDDGLPDVFDRHSDRWYTPDTKEGHRFAVRRPDDDKPHYYKTVRHAAERLREYYD